MALSSAELKKKIAAILKDADLETTSAKKVRTQLEEETGSDLTSRKEEIGKLIQEVMDENADDEDGKILNFVISLQFLLLINFTTLFIRIYCVSCHKNLNAMI